MLIHLLLGWRRSIARRGNRNSLLGTPPNQDRPVRTLRPALETLENRVVPTGGLVVFGDSLSDVGNLGLSDGNVETPSPPYYDGRFSNGTLWVETLASYLGDPPLQPSSVGGTDYAWGGAQVAIPGYPPSIPQQINQYLDNLAAAGQTISANDVFAVWAGTNDYLGTFLGANGPTNPIDPAESASALTDALQTLVTAGARTLVVNNLPLLGNSPYFKATDAFYQEGGALVASANAWTTIFNSDVATGLKALSGANVVLVDVAGLEEQVILNPAQYGFTNTSRLRRPLSRPVRWVDQQHHRFRSPGLFLFRRGSPHHESPAANRLDGGPGPRCRCAGRSHGVDRNRKPQPGCFVLDPFQRRCEF